MNNLEYKGNFSNDNTTVKMQLPMVVYVDDDSIHYMYCPALDLTGYGHSDKEAKKSFEQTLKLYLDYTVNKQTLIADLKAHGWSLKNKKNLVSPPFRDLLKHNKDFENIVDKCNFKKFTHELEIPDCVYA
jgi:hypothetical protein